MAYQFTKQENEVNNNYIKPQDSKKQPDVVTQELRKGFEWSAKHAKLVIGAIAFVAVGMGVISTIQYFQNKNTMALMDEFYKIEKPMLDKKMKFEQAAAKLEQQKLKTAADKNKKSDAKTKESEDEKINPADLASGDLQKDFGVEAKSLEDFIQKNPTSKPAQMAALRLSEIYLKYHKPEAAIQTLEKVPAKGTSLIAGLVLVQKTNVYMDLSKCDEASKIVDQILHEKSFAFMHAEMELKKALCLEAKDPAQAQAIYEKLSKDQKAGETSRSAEKYLRSLKIKGI